MKTSKRKMRSIGIFALVLVMLMSAILPLSAAGSAIDEAMGTYIVKQGDTLSSIAAAHGTTVSDIVTTNGISASAELYVGQKLDIPGAMAVEDDYLQKNPFDFELAQVIINDSITREAISKDQMRRFLDFVKTDKHFCKYYSLHNISVGSLRPTAISNAAVKVSASSVSCREVGTSPTCKEVIPSSTGER